VKKQSYQIGTILLDNPGKQKRGYMTTKGKGILRIAIEDFFSTTKIGKWIASYFVQFGEWLEDAIASHYKDILASLAQSKDVPDSVKSLFFGSGHGSFQGGIPGAAGFGLQMGMSAASGLMSPLMRVLNYGMDAQLHTARFDPSAAYAVMRRDPNLAYLMVGDMVQLGWDEKRIKAWNLITTPKPSEQALIQYWLRGKLSDQELLQELHARGWEDVSINLMKELAKVIPPVQDLISMAVRDAFSPEVVSRFQYDQGFPEQILEYTRKQGLPDEWVRRYWYAHWQLPSPQMGYEMLHRLRPGRSSTPFTKEDMELLLKTADYAPYFRDKLIAISYAPFTRVDVRRMYKLGILSYEDVIEAYKDLGYDDEKARQLAEFTVKYETGESSNLIDEYSDLSRSLVQTAYSAGLISEEDFRDALSGMKITGEAQELVVKITELKRQIVHIPDYTKEYRNDLKSLIEKAYTTKLIDKPTALSMLTSIDIPSEQAEMILSNADLKYTFSNRSAIIDQIGKAYVNQTIDRGTAITLLGKQNVSGAEQQVIMSELDTQISLRSRKLTQSQYEKAYLTGLISLEEYKQALIGLEYSDKDISILLKFAEQKLQSE
jgi:hypothetical protein